MELSKYSIGVGDRFAHQAKAQLEACFLAARAGIEVIPVWNKSNREHTIISSQPAQTRAAVDAAISALHWEKPYFCDADHITLATVDRFLVSCDFYTIDVADSIGKTAAQTDIDAFLARHHKLLGKLELASVDESFEITLEQLHAAAAKFLFAVQEAGKVYRKIESVKGAGSFVPEISMDETDVAQSPLELLIILAAIADEQIPLQTIAPKFSGRFNKGVEYVGEVDQFEREMALDMAAIRYAIEHFGLPQNLKLSVHSGSDKFSIYPAIYRCMQRFDSGVHLKTAGTTWLEELIGLAEAGGEGLVLAKEIYADAYAHREELCAPYATVIDIYGDRLPSPAEVSTWTSDAFTSALRHDQSSKRYNPHFRQLLHVGFKIAAKKGNRYLELLEANEAVIAKNVTTNIYERHIVPVFMGRKQQNGLEH